MVVPKWIVHVYEKYTCVALLQLLWTIVLLSVSNHQTGQDNIDSYWPIDIDYSDYLVVCQMN